MCVLAILVVLIYYEYKVILINYTIRDYTLLPNYVVVVNPSLPPVVYGGYYKQYRCFSSLCSASTLRLVGV
jgi:hypothetical protein